MARIGQNQNKYATLKLKRCYEYFDIPGCIAQSVTCLATDASLTADPEFDPGPVPYFLRD